MHSVTLSSRINNQTHTIALDKHNKETFLKDVTELFEGVDFTAIDIEALGNLPDVFRFPSITDSILADSFWSWKTLSDDDRRLLVYYIEITNDDQKTIEEARTFRDKKRELLRR